MESSRQRNQKIMMKSHGLDSEKYLVVKDTQEMMEVVAKIRPEETANIWH